MRLYFKRVKDFGGEVFFPDKEDRELEDWKYKSNVFKRYVYYMIEELMIVDDATGRYTSCKLPMPFSLPGRIYLRLLHIWQTKIVKTHI